MSRYGFLSITALSLAFLLPAPLTAQWSAHWYAPHYLSSADDAINKVQFMSAHFAPTKTIGYTLTHLDVNKLGINLTFSHAEMTDKVTSVVYAHINHFNIVDYSREYPYPSPWCVETEEKQRENGAICVPTVQDAHDLVDALATLALVSGRDSLLSPGLEVKPVPAKELDKHPERSGLRVTSVETESPPARAGIKDDDIISSVNGKPCTGLDVFNSAFMEAIRKAPDGGVVHVEVLHRGQLMPFDMHYPYMVLDPAAVQRIKHGGEAPAQNNAPPASVHFGIQVRPVIQDDMAPLALTKAQGLVVVSVENGGLADTMGVLAGDVILQLNGADVGDMQQFVQTVRSGVARTFRVWRKGKTVDLTVPQSL